MTHHPMPTNDENALCPNCDTEFGYVVRTTRWPVPVAAPDRNCRSS